MRSRSTGVLTSAVLAFAGGYVLWPAGYVYWTRVADVLGEPLTLALVALLAAAGGAVTTLRLAVPLAELVAGSVIAYAVGRSPHDDEPPVPAAPSEGRLSSAAFRRPVPDGGNTPYA
ncbi:hypothetical protein NP511_02855 [Natrinema thermotolerans]|uniref:Uncharacterized protein n=1 Tax=Natrinema thermotolerans TaxID=121872 RepID=A0AAF0SZN9_9EURY|nr:hypothetical protein [Natrinema thermotolerans]WMT08581.1 hypothetical protein NP511_02855 [Natrinema thermotolerans]